MGTYNTEAAYRIANDLASKAVEAGLLTGCADGKVAGKRVVDFMQSIIEGLTTEPAKESK
jgi:hypothetical protein